MELIRFLNMAKKELKCLDKKATLYCFSMKQFCIAKYFLLVTASFHSASRVQLRSYLEEKVAALV
jgi:hypothetical protein